MSEGKLAILAVVNKYMNPVFAIVSSQIRKSANRSYVFSDGNSIFKVAEIHLGKVNQHKHDLIGVYDNKIEHQDLMDDLHWYAVNYLEAK